eukprot:g68839.t1
MPQSTTQLWTLFTTTTTVCFQLGIRTPPIGDDQEIPTDKPEAYWVTFYSITRKGATRCNQAQEIIHDS